MFPFDTIEQIFQDVRDFSGYTKSLVTIATAVGFMALLVFNLKLIWWIIKGLRLYVFSRFCCQVNFREKYGQWAVISGATDGIGLAMAKELARRGMSIVVIGRNDNKLAATKVMLEKEANVGEVVTVKIDLSDSSLENFEAIRSQIDPDNRDIGLLINNAGTFPKEYLRFNRYDMDFTRQLVNINILGTLHLTKMIMPGMIGRGKGLVVNVSSVVGSMTTPYMCVYGATKSFVDAFSRQLQIEYSGHPIDIINLAPGGVHTNLYAESFGVERPTWLVPTPDAYAKSAVSAISTRISRMAGYFSHEILTELVKLIPFFFTAGLRNRAKQFNLSPVPKRRPFQADAAE